MRRRDDFVARLDAEPTHGDVQRVSAVRAGNAVPNSKRPRPCLFKGVHMATSNVRRVCNDFRDGRVDLRLNTKILGMQINERTVIERRGES